jgi:hypothetical protein
MLTKIEMGGFVKLFRLFVFEGVGVLGGVGRVVAG